MPLKAIAAVLDDRMNAAVAEKYDPTVHFGEAFKEALAKVETETGRAVVRELVRAGHKVRATARGEDKAAQVRALGAEPVAVDLYNRDSIRAALNGAGALLRLTTKIPPLMQMRRASAWRETIRLRTQSAEALVDAALATGVKTYLHESVAFIYRDGGEDWIDETHPVDVEGSSILAGTFEGERHAKRVADPCRPSHGSGRESRAGRGEGERSADDRRPDPFL